MQARASAEHGACQRCRSERPGVSLRAAPARADDLVRGGKRQPRDAVRGVGRGLRERAAELREAPACTISAEAVVPLHPRSTRRAKVTARCDRLLGDQHASGRSQPQQIGGIGTNTLRTSRALFAMLWFSTLAMIAGDDRHRLAPVLAHRFPVTRPRAISLMAVLFAFGCAGTSRRPAQQPTADAAGPVVQALLRHYAASSGGV